MPMSGERPLRPPRLVPGDRVLLVAPAGPVSEERIEVAIERCRALGFEPEPGASVRERHGYLAGPDPARAADVQRGIEDESVAALWAIRGGYGSLRLLPRLDLSPLRRAPKPFIGLSDNTALHLALDRAGLVSFHGPHAGAERFPEHAEECFRRVLCRAEPAGVLPGGAGGEDESDERRTLAGGRAEGALVGGNLALLAATCGTPYQLRADGRIVLIEDVGEVVYRIDRALTQLTLAGALDGAAAVAFGSFARVQPGRHPRPLEDVLREWVEQLGVPAVLGLPFGHIDHNWTLPLGVRAQLDADAGTLELLEAAVR